MSEESQRQIAESVPVQLTRMEGVLNLVSYKVDSLVARVDRHETEIDDLKSLTQRLDEQATASTAQDAALVADRKAADEKRWTPFSRIVAFLTAVGTVDLSIYYMVKR